MISNFFPLILILPGSFDFNPNNNEKIVSKLQANNKAWEFKFEKIHGEKDYQVESLLDEMEKVRVG